MRRRSTNRRFQPQGRSRVVLLSTAAIAGLVASSLVIASIDRGDDAALGRLAAVVGPHRVTLGRLTGGFSHALCDVTAPNDSTVAGLLCRESTPSAWSEARALSKLAAEMRSMGAGGAGKVSRHHAFGSWNIVWRNADAAVAELRTASQLAPADARVQNDLGAALLQRAELRQDPLSILDAYTAVDSALKLDPRLAEARFNRALILEQVRLRDFATEQWRSYLDLDATSLWAEEARSRLKALQSVPVRWIEARPRLQSVADVQDSRALDEIARKFPRQVREEARRALLDWARQRVAGSIRSDSMRGQARVLARSVNRATGDPMLLDIVSSIDDAATLGSPGRIDSLARGLVFYAGAHRLLDAFQLDSASRLLAEAHRTLWGTESPIRFWVAQDSAILLYQRGGERGYDGALRLFDRIRGDAPSSYKVVRGVAARGAGLIHAIRANYDAAVGAYQAAIVEGTGAGDPALELRPRVILASLYAELRGEQEAWGELYAGLRLLGKYPEELGEAQRLYVNAAELSWRRSPRLALLFQQEAVALARIVDGSGTMTITALSQQAQLLGRFGESEPALRSLRQARGATDSIASDSIRAIKTADVDLVEGEVLLRVRPDSAVRVLRRVVDQYRTTQYFLEMDRAELLLANAYAASGNMDAARTAFDASLAETERRRAGILDTDDRVRFLDQARPVIDRILKFSLAQADTVGAFEFFERMRARVLLERVRANSQHSTTRDSTAVDQLRRTIPRGTSAISYALLDSELVSWFIDANGISMRRTPVSFSVPATVARFSALIEAGSTESEIRATSAQLYQLLIAPWRSRLGSRTRLVILPDKSLHFVPFGALFDESAGQFLVESVEITIAPSLALYHASLARYAAQRRGVPRVLAVGNPAFDPRAFKLPRLPGAEAEAVRVAKDYNRAHVLLGGAATKRAFLREAEASDIVHFAGHGVVTPDAPLLSHLVLASEPGDGSSAALYARDLFAVDLPRTRLAILSGCHTAAGRLSETEGVSSLARALFAAGVPAVIASLWAVNDALTADFFVQYHQEVANGADPATALQHTQLRWLANAGNRWAGLSTWAGFQLFGATGGIPAT